ncbi:MAG: substrate-binding domain-containing protein [Lachnospiraceae bacterium]|nr:substrate-binding domain-containing protein [Lachnospiraceae bacterium]MDD3616397.1 substrate-binding domain-containing protein [Lachnospiraceae bacterium]
MDNISDMISRDVDMLFLSTCDANAVIPAIIECTNAGVPVIMIDTPIEDASSVLSTVCSDNYMGGQLAADALVKAVGEDATIVTYTYNANLVAALRGSGFIDTVKEKYPNVTLVNYDGNMPVTDTAMEVMEDILISTPDIDGVFCINDPAAIGCSAAVKSAGKSDQIKIVGFDGSEEGIDLIKAGEMLGSTTQYPYEMGKTALEAGNSYLSGEEIDNEIIIDVGYIDLENLPE